MEWVPFLLIFASGSFMVPMLVGFQRQMGALEQKIHAGEAQIQEGEANIKKFLEEEERLKADIEKAKTELAALDRQREEQEFQFRELKKFLSEDFIEEEPQGKPE